MKNIHVRTAKSADRDWLVKAIADEQEHEHTLHDTRKPGAEVAKPYLAHLEESVSQKSGVILVAEIWGTFAGYAACWIEQGNVLTETDDSNRSGYVADAYVVPALRGSGIAGKLLKSAEAHLRALGVSRMRIGVLANNSSARRAYEKYGFVPYEFVLEKKLA
jgi:ribosomal protein S18 acetylase RimI-like enzyme